MSIKPILFNTEMVKAILEGRKTVTRRVIKLKYGNTHIEWKEDKYGKRLIELQNDVEGETHGRREDGTTWRKLLAYRELKPPYQVGDVLYVRETWNGMRTGNEKLGFKTTYWYKADDKADNPDDKWRPSIFMPKEAARIWLKVTDVRVERLNDITKEQAGREGVTWETDNSGLMRISQFIKLWNSTLKKSDYDKYCWNANPWVWVIEFEKCDKPAGQQGDK